MRLSNLFKPTNLKRILFFLVGDIFLSIVSIYLSYLLRFNFDIPDNFFKTIPAALFIILVIKIPILYFFRQYFITWRFYSFADAKNLLKANFISYFLIFLIFLISFNYLYIPRGIAIIDFFISLSFLGGFRFFKRLMLETSFINHNPTIFIGINNKSIDLIKSALRGEIDIYPIAVLDEKPNIQYLSNVKVLDINELENIKNIKTAIITKELSQKELDKLTNRLTKLNIDIKIATNFRNRLKDISIEDLLARKPKDIDQTEIKKFIKDRTILVTGAGGSIGSEIVRQCDKFGAKQIIMVDKCEFNLYKISNEVDGIKVLCSVNSPLLEETFKKYKPEIVIHAAAYKHVPLCEENPKSCIFNNVFGSIKVIDLAIRYRVKKLVNISTDKAVRPTNVMGASKRIVEMYAKSASCETEIVSVRFGNVLGSSGSVVPFFKEKIENNENLPVTHPEITRYFMLIPEACSLVLQAGAIAKGGELFILDMGEPVKIKDLAEKMIALSGKNLKVEFVGLRAGEKLYEELLVNDADLKTKYESILIVNEPKIDLKELRNSIEKLKNDITILPKIVKDYTGSLSD